MKSDTIFTIGHSNHDMATFLQLLTAKFIQVVVDVRSAPYSRYVTWFNKRNIQSAIQDAGLKYIFMCDAIGGKPSDPGFSDANGRVLYSKIAESKKFRHGLDRLRQGLADGWRIALMCAEKDPGKCHRHLLIAKELVTRHHIPVLHIRSDGSLLPAEDLLDKDSIQPRLPIFSP
ncbi:MAG: DUF488 domain-containing protein [Proteobacteria bacterium]|nr:DUF488 domain-containing protein [Pseudomonadota bacterium]MBU0966097.1 DUF488 domain-containing protein [Pseudomonadota bacterium]